MPSLEMEKLSTQKSTAKATLHLTPQGHLLCSIEMPEEATERKGTPPTKLQLDVQKSFEESTAAGLFHLAQIPTFELSPTVLFFRSFACKFMHALCHTPEENGKLQPIAKLSPADLTEMVLSVPPMRGAEYLTEEIIGSLWEEMEAWIGERIASYTGGFAAFLREEAPTWHHVGRVCFHLAENKNDPEHPFAFMATYATKATGGGKTKYVPLSKALVEYAGAKNKNALLTLLSPIHRASKQSEMVARLVETGDIYHPLAWSQQDAYQFLKEIPLYEDCGLISRLPNWWKKKPRPRVRVAIGSEKQSKLGTSTLLDFDVSVAIGGKKLSEAEVRALLRGEEGLVLFRGQWIELDKDKLKQALEHWQKAQQQAADGLSFVEAMRLLSGATGELEVDTDTEETREWAHVEPGEWLRETLTHFRNPGSLSMGAATPGLRGTLRDYQQTGVNWLHFLSSLGLGACLADDMGLGKTVQVISLLLLRHKRKQANGKKVRKTRSSLLVLPASLLANWHAEIEKFGPSLSTLFVHSSYMKPRELATLGETEGAGLREIDVVLTTYTTLVKQSWMADVEWELVVLDEAQAIKNPGTRQSKMVKKLRASSRITLTGTPVENRVGDLWSLFDFLSPGLLGSSTRFGKFVKQLRDRPSEQYAPLRRIVSPYILRRLKTDKQVINDLPEKTEVTTYCGLSKKQIALYRQSVDALFQMLSKAHDGEKSGIRKRGLVLSFLTRFKQICNHPSHFLGDGEYKPTSSGKFVRLAKICEEIASRQEKALIFTQFREIIEPIAFYLEKVFGAPGLVLHGGTAVRKRQEMVDLFQAESGPPFLVLSLKAGGTGLNLTAASHVIHFDRWWNPAVENQATDRAFRIGQKCNVLVHKFVCRGTIEEKINSLIQEKTDLAHQLIEGGQEVKLTEMADDELLHLVSIDINKATI